MMKLWKHQQYAIDKYKNRKSFGFLFDCGLGKTLTTIKVAEEKEKPVLIIAPNALCKQWEEEINEKGSKDWQVVTCISKTKNTKNFKKMLEEICDSL